MGRINKIISYIFIAFLASVLLSKFVYLFDLVPSFVAIFAVLIIIVFIAIIYKNWNKIYLKFTQKLSFLHKLSLKKMIFIILITSLLTKLAAIFIFQINTIDNHPDVNVYATTANELCIYGNVYKFADYCYNFSHMFWFSIFLVPAVKVFGLSQLTLSIYTAIILTISVLLIFDTVQYKFNRKKAFIITIVFLLLPSQILLPSFITHEIALLFFSSISLWNYFRILPTVKNRWIKVTLYALLFFNLLFCTLVNSAGLILVIAMLIVFFISGLRKITLKNFLNTTIKCISLILVIAFGTIMCNCFQLAHSNLSEDYVKGDKVLWTLYVGSNIKTSGGYSNEDADTFNKYSGIFDENENKEYHKDLIYKRYAEILKNPGELLNLSIKKFNKMWSSYTYPVGFANETIVEKNIQNLYNKFLFKPFSFIEYVVSILAVILGLYSTVKKRKTEKSDYYLLIELLLLGTTALLLLSECDNKYITGAYIYIYISSLILCSGKLSITKN